MLAWLLYDVRHALRGLLRDRIFTLVAVPLGGPRGRRQRGHLLADTTLSLDGRAFSGRMEMAGTGSCRGPRLVA